MLVDCSKGLNKKFISIVVWSMLWVYSKISQSSFEVSCYKKKNKSAHIETQVSKWVWQNSQDKWSWVLSFPWPHWRPLSKCFSYIYDPKETIEKHIHVMIKNMIWAHNQKLYYWMKNNFNEKRYWVYSLIYINLKT